MRTAKEIERPAMRPELRDSSSVDRAAKRAAELRGHLGDSDEGTDKFATPPAPDGWSYEWKMKSVMGYQDPSYLSKMARTGWEPVQVDRHPEMVAKGQTGAIERDGMVLCERPLEITKEVRDRDYREARRQVKIKEGQLTSNDGLLGREDSKVRPKVNKNYEPLAIPD